MKTITKTITITVPVLPNPVKKINEIRKDFKRSIYAATAKYRYEQGDIFGAVIAMHQYKNV